MSVKTPRQAKDEYLAGLGGSPPDIEHLSKLIHDAFKANGATFIKRPGSDVRMLYQGKVFEIARNRTGRTPYTNVLFQELGITTKGHAELVEALEHRADLEAGLELP